ncbi:MAG: VWA domain-containing protein [Peptostreptococcales bacterium]|jgi:uncharacterized protein with von Willebrand factor type A (vWA) domain
MENILGDFCYSLRNAGVRISVSETIDAITAVKHIGYSDQESFKYGLKAALVKTQEDSEIFDRLFFDFFKMKSDFILKGEDVFDIAKSSDKELSELMQAIIGKDDRKFFDLFDNAVDISKLDEMAYSTQQGIYVQKILDQLGMKEFDEDLTNFAQMKVPGAIPMVTALQKKKRDILEYTEDYVRNKYELKEGRRTKNEFQERIKQTNFKELKPHEIEEMKVIINKFVKKIYTRFSKRKKNYRKGILDIKRTIRKNASHEGLLFDLQWRYKKVNRPDIFVICDISKSVRHVSHFMLLFLYSLNEILLKIRSFVMCTGLVEISHVFKEFKAEEALERIYAGEDLDIMFGYTDYGEAFKDFRDLCIKSIKKTSTIIILGDARNNDSNPRVEILKEIKDKCKTLIWLNPEKRKLWGTNDSEMDVYLPYCDIAEECNTIAQLDRVLNDIFKNA